jgi:hypothetical protein
MHAYRIDNQLAKALKVYDKFYNLPEFDGNYNPEIVEQEIKACETAKIIQDSPIVLTCQNIDDTINSAL